jgi:hypothetical protein
MRWIKDYHFAYDASTLRIPHKGTMGNGIHRLVVEPLVDVFVSICLAANAFVQ